MTIRFTGFSGSNYNSEEILDDDFNQTMNNVATLIAENMLLGEVKMFDISLTGSETVSSLQAKGWAIQDGTTPVSQGITSPTIVTTSDWRHKFIRSSNDETSGSIGGTDEHNHQFAAGNGTTWQSNGSSTIAMLQTSEQDPLSNGDRGWDLKNDTNSYYTKNESTLPSYIEAAFFIKVKVIGILA